MAVVLAAGRGTRMRAAADVALTPAQAAAADAGHKFLVPIHGRPFLDHVLDELEAAGFDELCLVVAPDSPLLQHGGPLATRRVRLAVQPEPRGGADALLAAEPVVGDGDLVVINADNLYPASVLRGMRELDGPGLAGFDREALVRESNIPPDRVAAFALVREEGGLLAEIVEKPSPETLAAMAGSRVSMTCWRFDASIFDACRDVAPSGRGELELPDAVALAINRGARFRVVPVGAGVLDLSRREDIPVVERLVAARARR
ncbi:MAG TPA: sugar phosphate nucleotidyltransferase [Longimicrobiales bacterium]|nr:sugar phosphate nucleotidyltransferase [Longimicrobiales bacterium]